MFVAIERDTALKRAEKFLRQGKLESAIEEYVRLTDEQPNDWNAINALGDLYLRAGNTERAVAEFVRVADHLFQEGFLPKASALYKKALKVQPRHEHTMSQLADIAKRQGLLADAAMYLRQLLDGRRAQDDQKGIAEVLSRLRALEEDATEAPASSASKISAAVAQPEPIEQPEPSAADEARAMFDEARSLLSSGDDLRGRAMLTRVLTLDPSRHSEALQLALDLAAEGRVESGFGCVDVLSDAALLDGDWMRAIEALQTFIVAAPNLAASIKLVELCVDHGAEDHLRLAQAQLVDAYLQQGSGMEARVIAEDLLEQEPESEVHAERLRRALALLDVPDANAIVAEVRSRRQPVAVAFEEDVPVAPAVAPEAVEAIEIDLSEALSGIGATPLPQADPTVLLKRAMEHVHAGRIDNALAELQAAAAQPRTRARAAAELGRLYNMRDELATAVQWYELAADGPSPSQDEAFAVMYELADALARLGESSRALAILIDLDAEAGGYRDVRMRIDQLAGRQNP